MRVAAAEAALKHGQMAERWVTHWAAFKPQDRGEQGNVSSAAQMDAVAELQLAPWDARRSDHHT
jgi:hypothetical protein